MAVTAAVVGVRLNGGNGGNGYQPWRSGLGGEVGVLEEVDTTCWGSGDGGGDGCNIGGCYGGSHVDGSCSGSCGSDKDIFSKSGNRSDVDSGRGGLGDR